MTQLVKVLAAKPDDLKCIPGTCTGQNTCLQVVLGLQNSFCGMGTSLQDKINVKKLKSLN